MKKYFVFFIIFSGLLFLNNSAFAEESSSDKGWDDMIKFDQDWRTNHESVTDAEFEKVMQRLEKKKKKKKYEFEEDESRDSLNDMSILNEIANHSPVILFPTNLRSYEGDFIPAGHYKLNYLEKDKEHYLVLTQGRNVCAKLKMQPTQEDFKSESIQFADIIENDNESMKLIYGNLDLNLVKKLYIVR